MTDIRDVLDPQEPLHTDLNINFLLLLLRETSDKRKIFDEIIKCPLEDTDLLDRDDDDKEEAMIRLEEVALAQTRLRYAHFHTECLIRRHLLHTIKLDPVLVEKAVLA